MMTATLDAATAQIKRMRAASIPLLPNVAVCMAPTCPEWVRSGEGLVKVTDDGRRLYACSNACAQEVEQHH